MANSTNAKFISRHQWRQGLNLSLQCYTTLIEIAVADNQTENIPKLVGDMKKYASELLKMMESIDKRRAEIEANLRTEKQVRCKDCSAKVHDDGPGKDQESDNRFSKTKREGMGH